MPADEFSELIAIPIPENRPYHTVAGYVVQQFGSVPAVGDSFDSHGWRFEVLDMDGRRVDKVLALKIPATRRAV